MTFDRASMAGKVLDKYELLEKVGEGGMAEVYRGRHAALGREVAIKLLHPHLSATERNRLRFEREARAIESLEHENILRIFDYSGRDSKVCYIVTEFIDGHTLKEVLSRNGLMPSEVAAMIGIKLCIALAYAHQHGIIHRDIKPENVMIRQDGLVKLMDFGIARVLDESSMTLTGGLVGSPAYMSPEQASDRDVDERSDLFSLGTLLYRAATGQLPFTGNSAPVILRNILEGDYPDPLDVEASISPGLADVIQKALKVELDQRFASAAQMGAALREVLDQAEVVGTQEELRRYLEDPHGYEVWLRSHLNHVLVDRGRTLIAEGNSVAAMKLLNRVLCLDDRNEQVLALIQSMHRSRRRWGRYVTGAAIAMTSLGAFLVWHLKGGAMTHTGLDASQGVGIDLTWAPVSGIDPAQPPLSSTSDGSPLSEGMRQESPDAATGDGAFPAAGSSSSGSTDAPIAEQAPPARSPSLDSGLELSAGPQRALTEPRELQARRTRVRRPDGSVPPSTGSSLGSGTDERPQAATGAQSRPVQTAPGKSSSKNAAQPKGGSSAMVQYALLDISSEPFAEIKINNKPYGNTGLGNSLFSLPPGEYMLRLEQERCEPLEVRIKLVSGQIFNKKFYLNPLPARLRINGLPTNTELFLDDRRLGVYPDVPQPIPVPNPRASHRLRARYPDLTTDEWPLPALDPTQEFTFSREAPRD